MKLPSIKEVANNFHHFVITKPKCWHCKHFVRNGGKGHNGCRIDPYSFDNNWEYIPETYRAKDSACGYFELRSDIKRHLDLLSPKY